MQRAQHSDSRSSFILRNSAVTSPPGHSRPLPPLVPLSIGVREKKIAWWLRVQALKSDYLDLNLDFTTHCVTLDHYITSLCLSFLNYKVQGNETTCLSDQCEIYTQAALRAHPGTRHCYSFCLSVFCGVGGWGPRGSGRTLSVHFPLDHVFSLCPGPRMDAGMHESVSPSMGMWGTQRPHGPPVLTF